MIFAALVCYGVALNVARPVLLKYGAAPGDLPGASGRARADGSVRHRGAPGIELQLAQRGAVLRSACSGTGAAYALAATNVSRLGSTRASVTTYLIPAVALGSRRAP